MKFCSNCGAQLGDGAKFCTECGQRIQQEAPVAPPAPVYEVPEPVCEAPAPVCEEAAPVCEAPALACEIPADTEVHVYGQPVSHNFSAPVITESEQSVVHTYGAPVAHTFTPPVQVETTLSGSYGGAAIAQPEPAAVPKEPAYTAPAPVAQESEKKIGINKPDLKLPEIKKPEIKKPDIKLPEIKKPDIKLPEIKKSDIKLPEIKKPDIKLPNVKLPNIPKQINIGGKNIRTIFLVGLVLILVIVLFSCVGGKKDPNQGIYNGVNYTYGGFELDASSDWIELKSRGKLTMGLLGDEYSGKWELEDEELVIEQGGDTYYGTLSGNVLVLDLDGVIYTYEKEIQEASEKEEVKEEPAQEVEKEETPEVGGKKYYVAISGVTSGAEMNESTIKQMGGVSLVLNGDGTGTFEMFGQSDEITYDDTTITRYNTPMAYTVDGDYLYLQVSEAIEFTLMTKMDAMNRPKEELTLDDMGYWEGDYYGWWVIENIIVGNTTAQGNWWDCCMTLDIQPDGTGSIVIWDEDYGKSDPIAEVEVSVSTYQGVTRIVSESGQFMGDNVEHADWLFYSDATDYKDSLGFTVTYEDDEIKMDCYFFLRQWGTIWDDVEEKDLPGHYESWYLPLIEGGETTAPDTIG